MVASGEMPPENKKPLAAAEKAAIQDWFHESFVLRDGKSHIGPTPLRRLTRYEFENTLEAVLAVPLKVPYRDSITGTLTESKITALVPSDIPGESGFDNDAHRLVRSSRLWTPSRMRRIMRWVNFAETRGHQGRAGPGRDSVRRQRGRSQGNHFKISAARLSRQRRADARL